MDIRFDGKTVIVTGAARGIGFACAEIMAESGATVALIDILGERLARSTKKLQDNGVVAKGYQLDLTRISDIASTVSQIRQDMGEVDVLIQAAALLPVQSAQDITEEEWEAVFDVNAKAVFFMMRNVVEQSMIQRKMGSIVNFASIAGLVGMRPPLCSAHYSGSKGAVIQITKQAAIEWGAHNIRANVVAPGGVKTEVAMKLSGGPEKVAQAAAMSPLKRFAEPMDIAKCVCFLSSDAASMINGHVLVIDGGRYAMG